MIFHVIAPRLSVQLRGSRLNHSSQSVVARHACHPRERSGALVRRHQIVRDSVVASDINPYQPDTVVYSLSAAAGSPAGVETCTPADYRPLVSAPINTANDLPWAIASRGLQLQSWPAITNDPGHKTWIGS